MSAKSSGKKIALCHGVFDLLHPGHFEHFRKAKEIAQLVIVSVTADEYVNKGPGRPVFGLETRMRSLSYLETIDFVIMSNSPTAIGVIEQVKPDFYIKGSDYKNLDSDITGMIKKEKEAVEKNGGVLYFTGELTSSSTKLINEHFSSLPKEVRMWINEYKTKYTLEETLSAVDSIKNLKVGILGEVIVDRYSTCFPLSKSSKDPILAFHNVETRNYPGGILAIMNNCAGWSSEVTGISVKDKRNTYTFDVDAEGERRFVDSETLPWILKHRFVDNDTKSRLFEYYDFNPVELPLSEAKSLINQIDSVNKFDLLIVADYGHGLITPSVLEYLASSSIFLCVNTQANAGNRGYNTIKKYSRANFIALNSSELQLELRSKTLDYESIVPTIMQSMNAECAVLTLGGAGLRVFNKTSSVLVPALASKVIDKVGAGDSVLAIASLLARKKIPIEIIGLVASVVAAHEVSQLGHQKSLSTPELKKSLKGLLG